MSKTKRKWFVLWLAKGYRKDTLELLEKECFSSEDIIYAPQYQAPKRNGFVTKYIFTGYLFVYCNYTPELEKKIKSQYSDASVLRGISNELIHLEEVDIQNIKDVEKHYRCEISSDDFNLHVGDNVEVKAGPFITQKGIIVRITDEYAYVSILIFSNPYEIPFKFFEIDRL